MEKGKKICKALKEIRKEIAKANDIDYEPHECHHEGDCAGTCPACESEVRWLESRLRRRQSLGKAVVLGGLTVAMGALVSSCDLLPTQTAGIPKMEGDIVCPDDSLANLRWLLSHKGMIGKLTVRLPHIPDYNSPTDVARSRATLAEMGVVDFDEFHYQKEKRRQ